VVVAAGWFVIILGVSHQIGSSRRLKEQVMKDEIPLLVPVRGDSRIIESAF